MRVVGTLLRGLLVGAVALVGLAFVAAQVDLGFDLNPFDERRIDRSRPPLLTSIQDLERYVAADGTFQVVVDLEDNRRYVPDFLLNDRILFVAVGNVQSYVDFGALDEGAVSTSGADDQTVRISLPRPRLDDASLDLQDSYVVSQERGLLGRVGDAFSDDDDREREVYQRATEDLDRAAGETDLLKRAEDNTRKVLTGLLRSLGYTDVTVDFDADDAT